MQLLRALILQNPRMAAVLLAAALCLKALVPAGYMPMAGERVLTLSICADSSGGLTGKQIVIPIKGESGGAQGKGDCAFSALGLAALGNADMALLALALAFVMALGFAPQSLPETRSPLRLRPPLRGPPEAA